MQNSVRWVLPVMSARMLRNSRSVIQGATGCAGLDLGEGDLEFGQAVLAGLVDPGMLAGRADELAAEQEGQAGVVVPEAQQRLQQVGAAQER